MKMGRLSFVLFGRSDCHLRWLELVWGVCVCSEIVWCLPRSYFPADFRLTRVGNWIKIHRKQSEKTLIWFELDERQNKICQSVQELVLMGFFYCSDSRSFFDHFIYHIPFKCIYEFCFQYKIIIKNSNIRLHFTQVFNLNNN